MVNTDSIIRNLRGVEAKHAEARRSNLRWTGITAAIAGLDPLVAFVSLGIRTIKEVKSETDWDQWKKEAGRRLQNKPMVAAELAKQTNNMELRKFFGTIARNARNRAAVRRRLGIQGKRTGPMSPLEARLRVQRRLRGKII